VTTPDETRPPETNTPDTIHCNQCGNEVPRLRFCIRCGDPLSDEYSEQGRVQARSHFAAAPHEPLRTVALISTLFPQLPRAEMRTFRLAFLAGAGIILVLALLGFYPVALVSAAVLVPLLMVMYVYVVDVYEDDPLTIIGATMLWGVAAGLVYGLLLRALPSSGGFAAPDTTSIVVSGIALPLFEGFLMLAGPLFLLPQRRFNDVLDGATFGAASAVAFAGTLVIFQALPILGAGLRPAGDPLPWVIQLLSLGVLQPVIAAGAVGSAAAAFWLRYRSPVTDRKALGVFGVPVIAVVSASLLLVAAGLTRTLLPLIPATLVLAVLGALGLLWLRATLHLGLSQESREITVTRSIVCPNCGHSTPEHSFCGHCGISLRALPHSKRNREADVAPSVEGKAAE
jgi:ribosomal protein L32